MQVILAFIFVCGIVHTVLPKELEMTKDGVRLRW